ncbi:MAG TPA: sugar ABC transporter permease [Symbiobacteriaceae bacterium]|nr:sugar ABC transporter permease [Symbiobacteriaceae bacterium]
MRKGETLGWTAAALPPILVVAGLFFLPSVLSVISSFQTKQGWSLANYQRVGDLYLKDIRFTVLVSLISLFLTLLIGVLVSGYCRLHQNRLVEWLFKIPLFVPFVVTGHAIRILLAPHGLANSLLASAGLINIEHPIPFTGNWVGIAIALAWKNMALAVLLILGAFRGVDESYLEAARNFGAAKWRQVLDVLLPMSKSSLAVVAVLIFTSMLGSFNIPVMVGGGDGAKMLMVDVYYNIVYQNNYGVANALGVAAYLLSAGAAVYYLRAVKTN